MKICVHGSQPWGISVSTIADLNSYVKETSMDNREHHLIKDEKYCYCGRPAKNHFPGECEKFGDFFFEDEKCPRCLAEKYLEDEVKCRK